MIKNGQLHLIINTTEGAKAIADSFTIRRQALQRQVTYTTTVSGARAICFALEEAQSAGVCRLQDLHGDF
jgi:carbamoyl-phosphate synthase large subunit